MMKILFVMKNVCQFLGIDEKYFDNYEFSIRNKSFHVRSQWIHKGKEILSRYLPQTAFLNSLGNIYRYFNIRDTQGKTEEEKDGSRRLHEVFIESNARLEEEFAIDLTCWEKI